MKKFILYFIILVLAIAFSGCDAENIPEENIGELVPAIEENEPEQSMTEEEKEEVPEEESETITFKLGAKGEEKEISVGDKIGEWKIAELFIEREDNGDYFAISVLFEGTVTLEGSIERNVILEEGYDIVLDESSLEKMPYLITSYYSEIRPNFLLDFSEEIENKPHLDWEETAKVRITVSNFSFDRAPRMSMDGFDVISIEYLDEEKEPSELYEEIILNFGAEKNKNGEYTLIKGGGGLFDCVKGFEDGSKMPAVFYHRWFSERCHHLGLSAAEFSMAFSPTSPDMGWVYPAKLYEPECIRFFGTTEEYLRSLENYVPQDRWYYLDTGAPGIGETPILVINSIDENEDTLVLHLTMDYEQGYEEDFNMALTVKLLPDGGYNYISYLPE